MISVVIPAYNEEKYIEKCLKSLMAQEVKPDEIIVVNNNSTDRTEEIVKKYPVILLTEKKKGIIPTRNTGFDAAKGTIIVRTDADTIVPPDWIKKIKARFEDKKLVALSGPAHFYPIPEVMQMYNWQTVGMNQSFKQVVGHDCMLGFNMALRKSAWEKVRDTVCRNDNEVHEDIDLSIHIAQFGKIKFDNGLVVKSSSRRLKKVDSYVEYPYRGLKSIAKHSKLVLKGRKQSVQKFVESIKFHNLF